MKRYLALLLAVALSGCGGDEDSEHCPDGSVLEGIAPPDGTEQTCTLEGKCHGWYKIWTADGELVETGHCFHGAPCGIRVTWGENCAGEEPDMHCGVTRCEWAYRGDLADVLCRYDTGAVWLEMSWDERFSRGCGRFREWTVTGELITDGDKGDCPAPTDQPCP